MKAKWLLDRRHGVVLPDLYTTYATLATYIDRGMMRDLRALDAHGDFVGETITTL